MSRLGLTYGAGNYKYGAKPHAVTNANSKAYAYDACGNMTKRGTQTLVYDEENQQSGVYDAGLTNNAAVASSANVESFCGHRHAALDSNCPIRMELVFGSLF